MASGEQPNGLLPDFLLDTYKTYKEDTKAVLKWLNGVNRNSKTQLSSSSSLHAVLVVTKAVVWSLSTSKKTVPEGIFDTLRRVISLRQRCSGWFTKHGTDDVQASNERHLYFISTMQQVLELLQNTARSTTLSAGAHPTTFGKNQSMKLPKTPNPKVTIAEKVDEDLIEIYCLVEDFRAVQEYVRSVWQQYKAGKVSLSIATMTTNAALIACRQQEDDFYKDHQQFEQWSDVVQFLFRNLTEDAGSHAENVDKRAEMFGSMMITSYFVLTKASYISLGMFSLDKIFSMNTKREDLSPEQRWRFDCTFMDQWLYAFKQSKIRSFPLQDEFTGAMAMIIEGMPPNLWMCLSLEIFCDIHSDLGSYRSSAHEQLLKTTDQVKSTCQQLRYAIEQYEILEAYLRTKKDLLVNYCDKVCKSIDEFVMRDFYAEVTKGQPSGCFDQPFMLLKHHPLLCGSLQLGLVLQMQRIGMNLLSYNDLARMAAQTYNWLLFTGFARVAWPSMEMFLDKWSSKIFLGRRPHNIKSGKRSIMLTMGYSRASFLENTRHEMNPQIKPKSKCTFELPALCCTYLQYLSGKKSFSSAVITTALGSNKTAKLLRTHRVSQPFQLLPTLVTKEERLLESNYCALFLEIFAVLKDLTPIMRQRGEQDALSSSLAMRSSRAYFINLPVRVMNLEPLPGTKDAIMMRVLGAKIDSVCRLPIEKANLLPAASQAPEEDLAVAAPHQVHIYSNHALYEDDKGVCNHWGFCSKEWPEAATESYLRDMTDDLEKRGLLRPGYLVSEMISNMKDGSKQVVNKLGDPTFQDDDLPTAGVVANKNKHWQ